MTTANHQQQPQHEQKPARASTKACDEGLLQKFIGRAQLLTMLNATRGDEGAFFREALATLSDRISTMPSTYQQDSVDDPIIYLHYFTPSHDFYIIERDKLPDQVQAFGYVKSYDGGELGYISIRELHRVRAELDIHFTPCPLSSVQVKTIRGGH